MKSFEEWLREVATGTNAVAVYARNIFSEPVKRRWPKKIATDDEKTKKIDELNVMSAAQTLPQGNQPTTMVPQQGQMPQNMAQNQVPATASQISVNPNYYKGANKHVYSNVYNNFMRTKNQTYGQALVKALQGDENDMIQLNKQPMNYNQQNQS